ncbi:MAG: MerR family transcriptional regulator, partial [Sphingomicrobium sp.]
KFPQLRPLQRAGNRRYYRPGDVALARRIHGLLAHQGYTVRGVQKLLADKATASPVLELTEQAPPYEQAAPAPSLDIDRLVRLRDQLSAALSA